MPIILENEEQRKALLNVIDAVPVQGQMRDVRETVKYMDKLKADIAAAAIAQKPDPAAEARPGTENPGSPGKEKT